MTAHAERVGVLALLGVLMLVGWCAVALGMSADSQADGARTVGAVVSKRNGSTTIVVGGPFAAAAIVVSNPSGPDADAPPADGSPDAVTGQDLPVVFGSVVIFRSSPVPDPAVPDGATAVAEGAVTEGAVTEGAVTDGAAEPGLPLAHDAAMLLDGVVAAEPAGFDGAAVVMEADRILADSAALEELWRLPAATADQRLPVTKQA